MKKSFISFFLSMAVLGVSWAQSRQTATPVLIQKADPRKGDISPDAKLVNERRKSQRDPQRVPTPNAAASEMEDNLKVEVFKLPNGLTVYLNEDHTLPSVYGGVAVNAGGKYDPADHTGMGHYLEHMLFKGTNVIGTRDFEKEKPYLDRITNLYDSLGQTKDEANRKLIQQKINEVAVQAAEFAVPNDLDKLLKSFGSTGVNAFTAFELIFYHNTFPSTEMEKWLTLYSDRFQNPVFRLFQSELEVVYEEKNRGQDNMGNAIFETFLSNFFRKHPYGQSIIGKTEHLKNPSLSKMYEYYNTYYVPSNMALVLCGDFDREKIKPMIIEKFGQWKSKPVTLPTFPKEEPFKGREVISKRLSPVKIGLMGFRTVPNGHADSYGLEVVAYLLSNSNQTGYLDKLVSERKLMMAQTFPLQLNDEGGYVALFVPKIIGQSLKKAEGLIVHEFSRIKRGDFTDAQLAAAKQQLKIQFYRQLEENDSRGVLIANLFTEKRSWDTYMEYPQAIDALTKNDIMRIANSYLGNNVLVMNSKMGFPKKDKLAKPGYKPVIPKEEISSNYAQRFQQIPSQKIGSTFVDFNKDLHFNPNIGAGFYQTRNPLNDICSFTISFPSGTLKNPRYQQTASYLNEVGSQTRKFTQFKTTLDSLGFTVNVDASDRETVVEMEGLEQNFAAAWKCVSDWLKNPEANEEKIKILVDNAKFEPRLFKREKETVGTALKDYAIYGKNSAYLNRLTLSEIKALKPADLLADWKTITADAATYHYVGRLPATEIEAWVQPVFADVKREGLQSPKPMQQYSENTILFLDDKKARQSHIWFYILGDNYRIAEEARMEAFNSYFGGDMSSLMFQEIREFRSLAYAARGVYNKPLTAAEKGAFMGYIGCQGDKTLDAVQTLNDMLLNLPKKPERIDNIRSGLQAKIPSNKPDFRELSQRVATWKEFGYKEDPSVQRSFAYPHHTFNDIEQFHKLNLQGKPTVITIVGDKSQFDMVKLAKFGKIKEVTLKDIYRQ